jgi:predicted TIM-barrel enzyme
VVPQPIGQLAHWAAKFGDASAVIVTGADFSSSLGLAREVKEARSDVPVVIGGGVSHARAAEALAAADAVIVGSALEEQPFSGPISAEKARAFILASRGASV